MAWIQELLNGFRIVKNDDATDCKKKENHAKHHAAFAPRLPPRRVLVPVPDCARKTRSEEIPRCGKEEERCAGQTESNAASRHSSEHEDDPEQSEDVRRKWNVLQQTAKISPRTVR